MSERNEPAPEATASSPRAAALIPGVLSPASQRIETHISVVHLAKDDVWKIKKPVDFGFLDFTTLEKRRVACEAEVRLNRRLAPEVYIDIVPVTRDDAGRIGFGGGGEVIDWAVHMRRLSDDVRADNLLGAGQLDRAQLREVAEHLARFHDTARSDAHTAAFGAIRAIEGNVLENFEQTRDAVERYVSPAQAAEIERWQLGFLRNHAPAFERRMATGRIRDGHGDLRLEHIYLDGPVPTVIDCIEFNERFRFADVAADIAFLAMDLARMGRVDLAEGFVADYARAANDFDLYPLLDFYLGYRAYVRGKISSFVASDPSTPDAVRRKAEAQARRYFLLALSEGRRPLIPPAVVAVGGVIASGKSTVAEALSQEMSAPIVEADRTRKAMIGVAPTEAVHTGSWQGAYDPTFTDKVYAEVRRRAAAVLASRRPVILDASFRSPQMREAARQLARTHGVPFRFVECRVDPEVARERLRERAKTSSVSDGRLEIFDDFIAKWQPPTEVAADEHLVLDTSQPLQQNLEAIRAAIATWPRGLVQ